MGLLDYYVQYLEDYVVLCDFNEDENTPKIKLILSQQSCKNIIKNKT